VKKVDRIQRFVHIIQKIDITSIV